MSDARKALMNMKAEYEASNSVQSNTHMATQIPGLNLDEFDNMHWQALEKYDNSNQKFRLETQLNQKVNSLITPLHAKVVRLTRLIDQIIINVDKHENQIDVVEAALYGRSRAMNVDAAEQANAAAEQDQSSEVLFKINVVESPSS